MANLNKKMYVTISIPDTFDKKIDELIFKKKVKSRSHLVRMALRDYLKKEFKNNIRLLDFSIPKKEMKMINRMINKTEESDLRYSN